MSGGLPAAAFGGRREIMVITAPSGPVYQAGTLSGTRWPSLRSATLRNADASVYQARRQRRPARCTAGESLTVAGVAQGPEGG